MYLEYQFASYIGCEENLRKVLNSKKNRRQIHDSRDSNYFTQLLKKKEVRKCVRVNPNAKFKVSKLPHWFIDQTTGVVH